MVTAIKKISSGASRLIRYQRSGTRHRKLRRARSRTPACPLTSTVTINAGTADPRTLWSTPCGVAPPGRSPGSFSPWGTNRRAVVVAYTSTKKVAIGCLTIHDLSGERSFRAACSAGGPAMIGTSSQQINHQRQSHSSLRAQPQTLLHQLTNHNRVSNQEFPLAVPPRHARAVNDRLLTATRVCPDDRVHGQLGIGTLRHHGGDLLP
jgi:hypothetical protein